MKIAEILNGWENFIDKSEVTETMAKDRATICKVCPYAKSNGILKAFVKDKLTEVQGSYCDLCKCPLSAKVRSMNSKCDIDKW